MKTLSLRLLAIFFIALLAGIGCRSVLFDHFKPKYLQTGPNGPETPQTLGLAYQRLTIPSGRRHLDGYLVRAPGSCQPQATLLIFHGVMETISEWVSAQRFLYDHCISSVVFDYSGHGNSSRPGTFKNLRQDAIAGYSYFASQFPNYRVCVLGHSMGNGVLLEAIRDFQPAPSCVVIANAFSSLRDLGVRRGTPRMLLYMIPDAWNNVLNISNVKSPVLVVHSDTDSVNPLAMGQRVFDAAGQPKQIVVLHGFKHNDLYKRPQELWWTPVIQFVRDSKAE